MKAKSKKMGRPPIEEPSSERLPMVRVTPNQLTNYKAAAEKSGKSFSAWIRSVLDKASKG